MSNKHTKIINMIKECGFLKVKFYDEDLNFLYFDAILNNKKVEVQINPTKKEFLLEWRYLGTPIEEIIWFTPDDIQKDERPLKVEIHPEYKSLSNASLGNEQLNNISKEQSFEETSSETNEQNEISNIILTEYENEYILPEELNQKTQRKKQKTQLKKRQTTEAITEQLNEQLEITSLFDEVLLND